MNDFFAALRWLTPIALGEKEAEEQEPPALSTVLPWLPMVGMLLGFSLFATTVVTAFLSPMLSALLVLGGWLSLGGMRHAMGLALTVSNHASQEGEQAAFAGILSLIFLLLAKWVMLTLIIEEGAWAALLLIPVWTLIGAIWWGNHVDADAQGDLTEMMQASDGLIEKYLPWLFALWGVTFFVTDGLWLAPLALYGVLWLMHRIGGLMQMKLLGAGIEMCEVMLLLAVCIMMG
ncbi:MAG: adenosylcobinamide-GDP ribazoletransferase [Zetaproteobacteria bacterium]|nr:adenosylcobinamide-GDP ribazoletransferase [Zetaproteobacteria bacterium]